MSVHGDNRRDETDALEQTLHELEDIIHRRPTLRTERPRTKLLGWLAPQSIVPVVVSLVAAAAVSFVVVSWDRTSSAPPLHAAEVNGSSSANSEPESQAEQALVSSSHAAEVNGYPTANSGPAPETKQAAGISAVPSVSAGLAGWPSAPMVTSVDAHGYRTEAAPWPPKPADLSRPEPSSKPSEISQSKPPLQQEDRVGARVIDPAHAAMLQQRADRMLARGDLPAARLILQRLAETGNGRAAYQLAETYDPAFLRQSGSIGLTSDIAQARMWYEKARDLGFAQGAERLQALASPASSTVGRR